MPRKSPLPRWVYYGTTTQFRYSFQRINLKKVGQFQEFGPGFYAYSQRGAACETARHAATAGSHQPLLITFKVDTEQLQRLNGLIFTTPDAAWLNFILKQSLPAGSCRPAHEFIYGPVADPSIGQCIEEIKKGRGSYTDLQKACQTRRAPLQYQLCCATHQALNALILRGLLTLT